MVKVLFIFGFLLVGVVLRRFLLSLQTKAKGGLLLGFHGLFLGLIAYMQQVKLTTDADNAYFLSMLLPVAIAFSIVYIGFDFHRVLLPLANQKREKRMTYVILYAVLGGVCLFLFSTILSSVAADALEALGAQVFFPVQAILSASVASLGIVCLVCAVQLYLEVQRDKQ